MEASGKYGNDMLQLSKYGYSITKSIDDRRAALDAASKDNDILVVLRRLNLVRNYQSIAENKKIFDDDIEYVRELYTKHNTNNVITQGYDESDGLIHSDGDEVLEDSLARGFDIDTDGVLEELQRINLPSIAHIEPQAKECDIDISSKTHNITDAVPYMELNEEAQSINNKDHLEINYIDDNYNISFSTGNMSDNYKMVKMLCGYINSAKKNKIKQMKQTNKYLRQCAELNTTECSCPSS